MSTEKERRDYVRQQERDSEKYGHGPSKRILGDMSFIDKKGNIVRPTRDNPFPNISGGYKAPDRKRHYDVTRAYGSDGQNRYHTYRPSGQDISGMMSIIAICTSIFFFSNNITGNAIANLSNTTTSYLGLCLLALGCISGFFWLKNKKRK